MSIFWNGKKAKNIKGEDNFVHTLLLPLTAIQGTNVLEIGGDGKDDCEDITIANMKLVLSGEPPVGPNLLKNGNFTETYHGPDMWVGRSL